jgi:hypothetical protein
MKGHQWFGMPCFLLADSLRRLRCLFLINNNQYRFVFPSSAAKPHGWLALTEHNTGVCKGKRAKIGNSKSNPLEILAQERDNRRERAPKSALWEIVNAIKALRSWCFVTNRRVFPWGSAATERQSGM